MFTSTKLNHFFLISTQSFSTVSYKDITIRYLAFRAFSSSVKLPSNSLVTGVTTVRSFSRMADFCLPTFDFCFLSEEYRNKDKK